MRTKIAQKIYSRLGNSPIEAEALAISLGLSAVSDLIHFNSVDNWKTSLDKALKHYLKNAELFMSQPRLLAIYLKKGDKNTLKKRLCQCR
jgi:hypothetical protein